MLVCVKIEFDWFTLRKMSHPFRHKGVDSKIDPGKKSICDDGIAGRLFEEQFGTKIS